MYKTELVNMVASTIDSTKAVAAAAVDAVFESIAEVLESGDKVTIIRFGTFSISERAAREGRNPATGESIDIDAKKVVKFKPGKELKERVA